MLARIIRLPVVLFLLCLIGGSLLQSRFPLAGGLPSFRVAMVAGVSLLAIASIIAASAILQMRRLRTTVEPGRRPNALVTSGVFAFSRNPIYVALLIILAAIAVMADALWLMVSVAVLWLLLDLVVVRAEERIVRDAFGESYDAYTRKVRRWL